MTTDTPVLTEFRFLLVGAYTMDVRVFATDRYQAKGKLLSDIEVHGETPHTKNRRYHGTDKNGGDTWCDEGLTDFFVALASVDIGKPFYNDDREATLVMRQLPHPQVENPITFRFELRYSTKLAYEVRIEASSLEAAIDQILDGEVILTATKDSDLDFLDYETMDPKDLEVELAMFAQLTATKTEAQDVESSVSYEIVEAAASATE